MSEGVGSTVGSERKPVAWLRVLGWAAYLACSWTWCIGMFLPVLLVRDYGPWGFVTFLVPNVIGAAAMGWVLRRPGHSENIAAAHRPLIRAFSWVTGLFQLYFFLWISRTAPAPASYAVLIAAALIVPGILLYRSNWQRTAWLTSGFVWLSSAAGLGFLRARGDLGPPALAGPGPGLGWLAPVCIFGFALCPYLDATFHLTRSRQQERPGTVSFIIGFCVLFLVMVGFTPLYAKLFESSAPMIVWAPVSVLAIAIVLGHISMQIAFTLLVHGHADQTLLRRPGRADETTPRGPVQGLIFGLALGLIITVISYVLSRFQDRVWSGLSIGEIGYRLFMSFYGLLFPAYVWLCLIPTWRRPAPPTTRQVAVWLGACVIAAPMYWMGFIERVEWWLGPGLAVVLLARLFIPRVSQGPDSLSGAPVPSPTHPPTLAAAASAGPDLRDG
ncbi:MAG: hypothetical protein IT436_07220 [Phycisphaerales bacterium]|nr:hypothetical protein [Phycisphaerales bacterium]